jgi:short subunit dehydrogenase-like uncharacterized protein
MSLCKTLDVFRAMSSRVEERQHDNEKRALHTGRLTAELAAAKKLDVVLAGRNKAALAELGDRLGLPTRVVELNDAKQLSEALKDVACVVHMAGPFAATSTPMLNACLATQTNYVDITGEIEVFEAMWSRKEEIRQAGITIRL